MATTFTIIAVFIPVAFMGGMVGQFFYEFGITVAAAVLVSLFVSFTLDPMLSSRWYDPDVEEDRQRGPVGRWLQGFNRRFDRLHGSYERTLDWSLRHRWVVSAVAVVAFVSAFPILAMLGGDFMPDYNRGEYQVAIKATPGATLRETADRAQAAVAKLRELPAVEYTYTTIGEAGSQYRPVTEGAIYLKSSTVVGRSLSAAGCSQKVENVPGPPSIDRAAHSPEASQSQRPRPDRRARQLSRGSSRHAPIPGTATSRQPEKSEPELLVTSTATRERPRQPSRSSHHHAAECRHVATTIHDPLRQPWRALHAARGSRRYAEDLAQLTVPRQGHRTATRSEPLSDIARCIPNCSSSIRRRDLVREVRVSANTDGRPLQELSNDINAAAARLAMPPGYDVVAGGDTEELEIMFRNMFQALMLAVIFIYLILASQFGSFTHPLAIMLSLPLSLVGVAVMLFFTHDTLNIMSMIGVIMLMGLVTKNAILLVDFTNQARREGCRATSAAAGRHDPLRPIVMTTLAMIFECCRWRLRLARAPRCVHRWRER